MGQLTPYKGGQPGYLTKSDRPILGGKKTNQDSEYGTVKSRGTI